MAAAQVEFQNEKTHTQTIYSKRDSSTRTPGELPVH